MPPIKLHRCSWTFLHTDLDACWKVQKELDAKGVPYEVVTHGYGKGKRPAVEALSGQKQLPVLELADATTINGSGAIIAWAKANAS